MGAFNGTEGDLTAFEAFFFMLVLMNAENLKDKGTDTKLLESINLKLERLCDKLC